MTEQRETPGEYLDRRYAEYTELTTLAGEVPIIEKHRWAEWPDAHYRLVKQKEAK